MRLRTALLALLPACGFSSDSNNGGGKDAMPDAPTCFGSYIKVCFDSASNTPSTPRVWPDDVDVDTDLIQATSFCDQNNDQKASYCVVTGKGIMLAATKTLRAHGSKPLVLLSTMAIDLEGSVDVSSTGSAPETRGAGENPQGACMGATAVSAASGGAGGSFAGKGGNGEPVDTGNLPQPAPAVNEFPRSLRGGCPGGNGTLNDIPDTGGAGGSGGGAVAIIAPSLMFNAKINASGAGGAGGPTGKSGGGGGGSGGMIVLDVPMAGIVRGANGILFANGGGGGEGGAEPPSAAMGQPGSDPAGPMPAAAGGNTTNDGGNGGAGSSDILAGATAAGQSGSHGGGGAGGGGAGFIYAPGISGNTVISPPSQNLP